jgi:hypothetical protein
MADDQTFWAPPESPTATVELSPLYVVDNEVRGTSPMVLPSGLCVACAQPDQAGKMKKQTLVYSPAWLSIVLVVSCFIYLFPLVLIAYLILRKPLVIRYHMCPECARRRFLKVAFAVLAPAIGLAAAIASGNELAIFAAFMGTMVSLGLAVRWSQAPIRLKWKDGEFRLVKLTDEFLERLDARLSSHDALLSNASADVNDTR